jgi:DNA-binding transcriptional LysR family regulator
MPSSAASSAAGLSKSPMASSTPWAARASAFSVSRKVAELEEQLGVQLLQRTTRTLALTDAGAAFVEEAEGAIARLEAAEAVVSELHSEPRGKLRVTATVPLGEKFLAPIVADFLDAYPAVEVMVHLTDRTVDLVSERFDVALRAGELPDSSLVGKLIGVSAYRIVGSAEYLARRGRPTRPSDLSAHACLRFAKAGTAVRTTWPFRQGKRVVEVPVGGRLVSDDFVTLRTAAERGVGLARLPSPVMHAAIREGRLESVLDAFAPTPTPLHMLHAGARRLPSRTRAFIDFAHPRLVQAITEATSVESTSPGVLRRVDAPPGAGRGASGDARPRAALRAGAPRRLDK